MVKIIIVALMLSVMLSAGCINANYTGTYIGETETVVLFSDGTFSVNDEGVCYSGEYEIIDDQIYLKHPLMSACLNINNSMIYDDDGVCLIKQ